MGHYEHIAPLIVRFFHMKNINVVIEPHGSRGADLYGQNGAQIIGEIKHEMELRRDLSSMYWSSWNSANQTFGGKAVGFQLRSILPNDAEALQGPVKGWLCVICGQLRHWTRVAGLSEGWVVYENHSCFERDLIIALQYLARYKLIRHELSEHLKNIGFVKIEYLSR